MHKWDHASLFLDLSLMKRSYNQLEQVSGKTKWFNILFLLPSPIKFIHIIQILLNTNDLKSLFH